MPPVLSGIDFPMPSSSIDLIYSHQLSVVHCRNIDVLHNLFYWGEGIRFE